MFTGNIDDFVTYKGTEIIETCQMKYSFIIYSNALANITRRLMDNIKIASVISANYCRKPNSLCNVAFHWLTSGFTLLAALPCRAN